MGAFHEYDRESFLEEFFPEPDERAEVEAGAKKFAARKRYRRAMRMAFTSMAESAKADGRQVPRWTREELYDRRW